MKLYTTPPPDRLKYCFPCAECSEIIRSLCSNCIVSRHYTCIFFLLPCSALYSSSIGGRSCRSSVLALFFTSHLDLAPMDAIVCSPYQLSLKALKSTRAGDSLLLSLLHRSILPFFAPTDKNGHYIAHQPAVIHSLNNNLYDQSNFY
jgi:hypothetical protein